MVFEIHEEKMTNVFVAIRMQWNQLERILIAVLFFAFNLLKQEKSKVPIGYW